MNNKGFIQIKILTVCFVISILLFTLVPFLLNMYTVHLKEEYVIVAKDYIKEVKERINSLEYKQIPSKNEGLAIKLSSLDLGKNSPYGKFVDDYSYVVVLNMGEYYDYYFASIDKRNYGIPVVGEKSLNIDSIVYGKNKLTGIDKYSSINNLYINGTIFKKSDDSRKDDNNILIEPVSGDLTVSYEFKRDTHKAYDNLLKSIDTEVYNKEVTINDGVIKYDNNVVSSNNYGDINGFLRYISFPNDDGELYFSSFVSYNKKYVGGLINYGGEYVNSNIVFDSIPSILINDSAKTVYENENKYLMWNLMAIYPNNDNYIINECGALILRDTGAEVVDITLDTPRVMVGKSNNNCELGNIFAIRKDNVKNGNKFYARGYIKYSDKFGNINIAYSNNIVKGIAD